MQEFPPTSKLDPNVYGDQTSKITKEHIINSLDGLTVDQVRDLVLGFLSFKFGFDYFEHSLADKTLITILLRSFLCRPLRRTSFIY